MSFGEWIRVVVAALVAIGGLLLAREQGAALTADQLGVLIYVLAIAYIFLLISRHFDRRDRRSGE